MSAPSLSVPAPAALPWGWRLLFAGVRLLCWLFALGAGVLLLLWAALYFYLAPNIGSYKGQIEQLASQKLGLPLRIESVSASADALPKFAIRGVQLYDAQGRVALRLPLVELQLSPVSLLRLRAQRLTLVAPDLVLRRDAQGRIFVSGVDWGQGETGDAEAAADWFFSLAQFEVRQGQVLWIDEKRQAPPLALRHVDIGIRNAWGRHVFSLAATPPQAWGQRVRLQAKLRGHWLSAHPGAWRTWRGQIYSDFPLVNAVQLGHYLDGPLQVLAGAGAVRSWAELDRGRVAELALDVALARVALRLQPDLPALDLQDLQGRLLLVQKPGQLSLQLKDAQLASADGQQWRLGALHWDSYEQAGATAGTIDRSGKLRAQNLSLPMLAQLAQSLPMAARFRQQLLTLAPQGQLQNLEFSWQGDLGAPRHYQARGRVQGLALAAQAASSKNIAAQEDITAQNDENAIKNTQTEPSSPELGRPGLAGADLRFDLHDGAGQASVQMRQGWLEFPGVFAQPRIALDSLQADLRWQLQGEAMRVEVSGAQFANADIAGSAKAVWHTSPGAGEARFPGVLDLQGQFERAQAARAWRYLPLEIPQDARDYVQQAGQGGVGRRGSFVVKGNLLDIPSKDPKQSTFRIAAHIDKAYYQYVPKALLAAGDKPWPALRDISGQLLFDGYGMQIQAASAQMGGMQVKQLQAGLADWDAMQVQVQGQLQGDLGAALDTVRGSGVEDLLGGALQHTQGGGEVNINLRLDLPIDDLERSSASGELSLAGNSLHLHPDMPALQGVQGRVRFDETGFVLEQAQAQALGGTVRAQGGMGALAGRKDAGVHLRLQGQATSAAMQQQKDLPSLAQLAQYLQGGAGYELQLDFLDDLVDFSFNSSLQGMAVHLPAPLGKTAAASQALHISQRSQPAGGRWSQGGSLRQLQASWGQALAAQYEIAPAAHAIAGATAKASAQPVVRGQISLGALPERMRLPDTGVEFALQAEALDAQAWHTRLSAMLDASEHIASQQSWAQAYMPQRLALRVGRLALGDRALHGVDAKVERSGSVWKISGKAAEFSGQGEYQVGADGQAGSLRARLQQLNWTEAQSTQLRDDLLHAPSSIPALDVVVDDFRLRGQSLGKLEIQASNEGAANDANREWRLHKLNLSSPEAQFSGTGVWLPGSADDAAGRTVLNFTWGLQDAGKLLARFGQGDVLAKGKGRIDGQISWQGAITAPDYASMNGRLQVQVADGRFLQADPGAAKLLGVLNLQALPRRLSLDFRDVFAQGFSFDFVRGDVIINKGLASTNNLQMKGVNAAVLMEGVADIQDETQDLHVVVVPQINAGTAALVATAINPAVGLGAFIAQWLLSKPVNKAATQELRITGSWADPKVEKIERKLPAAGAAKKK